MHSTPRVIAVVSIFETPASRAGLSRRAALASRRMRWPAGACRGYTGRAGTAPRHRSTARAGFRRQARPGPCDLDDSDVPRSRPVLPLTLVSGGAGPTRPG